MSINIVIMYLIGCGPLFEYCYKMYDASTQAFLNQVVILRLRRASITPRQPLNTMVKSTFSKHTAAISSPLTNNLKTETE